MKDNCTRSAAYNNSKCNKAHQPHNTFISDIQPHTNPSRTCIINSADPPEVTVVLSYSRNFETGSRGIKLLTPASPDPHRTCH